MCDRDTGSYIEPNNIRFEKPVDPRVVFMNRWLRHPGSTLERRLTEGEINDFCSSCDRLKEDNQCFYVGELGQVDAVLNKRCGDAAIADVRGIMLSDKEFVPYMSTESKLATIHGIDVT
jgi:hypothetical protein